MRRFDEVGEAFAGGGGKGIRVARCLSRALLRGCCRGSTTRSWCTTLALWRMFSGFVCGSFYPFPPLVCLRGE